MEFKDCSEFFEVLMNHFWNSDLKKLTKISKFHKRLLGHSIPKKSSKSHRKT